MLQGLQLLAVALLLVQLTKKLNLSRSKGKTLCDCTNAQIDQVEKNSCHVVHEMSAGSLWSELVT
jgi:hypothetical protein